MNVLPDYPLPKFRAVASLLTLLFSVWLVVVFTHYYFQDKHPIRTEPNRTVPSAMSIEQAALPPLPKNMAPITLATKSAPQHQTKSKPIQKTAKHQTAFAKAKKVNQKLSEQTYQALTGQGVDVQIAWPQTAHERQAVSSLMYQCLGVQFAVLNDNKVTHIAKQSTDELSDWVRVAQGTLTEKEQNWLAAFALSGTPIRLFPRHVDLTLAAHVASELHGSSLTSLHAQYQIQADTLHLTNIILNDKTITGTWPLDHKKC